MGFSTECVPANRETLGISGSFLIQEHDGIACLNDDLCGCVQVVSTGGDGLLALAQREYKVLTYRSLQPCYDFLDRGVSKLQKYFYREHSLMLWEATHRYAHTS